MTYSDFNVKVSKGGYSIFYKGENIGGVTTLNKGSNLRGRAVYKQIRSYMSMADREIWQILQKQGSEHYHKAITRIDDNYIKQKTG